jgi:predicted DNA-binding antitoxin AbrB/MazE fold protein
MTKTLQAVFENGVLRPLEPLDLPEHQEVNLVLTPAYAKLPNCQPWLDTECLQFYAAEADESITLDEVRQALSKIPGSMTEDFVAERDEP